MAEDGLTPQEDEELRALRLEVLLTDNVAPALIDRFRELRARDRRQSIRVAQRKS